MSGFTTIHEVLANPDFNAWMEENIERTSSVWNRNGQLTCEIYVDYRDRLNDKQIKGILEAPDPMSTFYDWIIEAYADVSLSYEGDIINELMKMIPDDFLLPFDEDEIEDIFREWITEHVVFQLPESHYLSQDVCVDILVDVGDGNYDFTMNNLWNGEFDPEDPSAILWLLRQQGCPEAVIKWCVDSPDIISQLEPNKLMKSIHEECLNRTSHMGILAFLVKMTLEQAIQLNELMNERNKMDEKDMKYYPERRKYDDYIVLDKSVTCGLYDPWHGSGSVLEIALERDVVLPVKFIDSAMPDGWRGYGIHEIYGCTDQLWSEDCVRIVNTKE